jgi:hypothetical protein
MKEVWKDVVGYEGYYQVSNLGRVRSVDRTIYYKDGRKRYILKGRVLKLKKMKIGYRQVNFHRDSDIQYKYIHRLVAEAFLKNENDYKYINHKDAIKHNNIVSNLEWCNQSINAHHAIKLELFPRQLSWKKVKGIREDYKKGIYTQEQLFKMYNTNRSTISTVIRNISYHDPDYVYVKVKRISS